MKKLMTGNEVIVRGAYEEGVKYASAYPLFTMCYTGVNGGLIINHSR